MKMYVVCVCVVLAAMSVARADWDSGDSYKMHFPQMPNPNGWDVCLNHAVIADDFLCTETGPITDVHFWVSWQRDNVRWDLIQSIGVNLYSDDGNHPGSILKAYNVMPTDPNYSHRLAGSGAQGWFCPATPFTTQYDHNNYYQINIQPLSDPLVQVQGTRYWLGLTFVMLPDETPLDPSDDPQIGWKTSLDRWGSGSEWKTGEAPWQYVMPNGQGVDQAFVITPEPATMVLLAIGGLLVYRKK